MTNRTVLVRLRADVSDFVAKSALAKAAVRDLHNEIDKSNDRTAWLAQGILALTPAVTRLGAGAIPVLSGMATQMMLTVAAAGTMAIAFNGVGDALGALNEYQLDPTAEKLQKLNEAMAKIGPDGAELVQFLDSLGPTLAGIANTARGEMFPGVIDGLTELMELAPQVDSVVGEIANAIGQLASEGGEGLSGDRFEAFFEYLDTRAKPLLIDMGRTLGNFTLGLANMFVQFDPLTEGFSKGLLDMSRSFAAWSEQLSSSTGFQEFLAYVQEAGPDALDFFGSLIMALVEIAEAAAPVGAVMLPFLTQMLDVIGDLANTPLGPATIALLAYTSAVGRLAALSSITGAGVMGKLTQGVRDNASATRAAIPTMRQFGSAMSLVSVSAENLDKKSRSYSQHAVTMAANTKASQAAVRDFGRTAAPIAGQVGLLAFAMTDLDDKMGLTNTTALTLAGSLLGPWGAAAGAAAGAMLDMKAAGEGATDAIRGLDGAAESGGIEVLRAQIAAAKDELADINDLDFNAGDIFDRIKFSWADTFGGVSTDEAQREVDEATEALARQEAELLEFKRARAAAAEDDALYNSLTAETAALEANVEAMRAKRAEAIRGLNAELDYKASLLDAADALKENGRTVDENTRKGQDNLRALYGMAAAFNNQGDAAKDSAREVRAGREAFVRMAEAMGMGEQKARDLARELYELPAQVPIKIGVDHETAMAHARAIKAELASIDRNIDVYVNVRRPNASGFGPQATSSADGSTVPDSGRGYADRWHYLLADREEVISNRRRQADRYRPVLKAINADLPRSVIKGMLADGGTAGGDDRRRRAAAGLFVPDQTAALEAAIRRLTDVQEHQTEAVEHWTQSAEGWAAQMADVSKTTVSGFNTSVFDSSSRSPWGAGAGSGPLFNLRRDISGLQERSELQSQLGGLRGEALAAVLSGTNADISGLISRGELGQFAELFNQRSSLQASVGATAGQMAFGGEFAAARANQAAATAAAQETNLRLIGVEDELRRHTELLEKAPDEISRQTATGVVQGGNQVARRRRRDGRGR